MKTDVYFPSANRTVTLSGYFYRRSDLYSAAAARLLDTCPPRLVIQDIINKKCTVIRRHKENMQELNPEATVKGYADMNPKLLIYYGNVRFSAYRVLNRGRIKETLTDEERELILADQGSPPDRENFVGSYYVVPHSFEVVSKPYCTAMPDEEESRIMSEFAKGRRRFTLTPGAYRVEVL